MQDFGPANVVLRVKFPRAGENFPKGNVTLFSDANLAPAR